MQSKKQADLFIDGQIYLSNLTVLVDDDHYHAASDGKILKSTLYKFELVNFLPANVPNPQLKFSNESVVNIIIFETTGIPCIVQALHPDAAEPLN